MYLFKLLGQILPIITEYLQAQAQHSHVVVVLSSLEVVKFLDQRSQKVITKSQQQEVP